METVNIKEIYVPERVRKIDINHVKELAESIKSEGLFTPIVLSNPKDRKKLRLVAGEHRLEAFKTLLKETGDEERYGSIPCLSLEEYLVEQGVIEPGQKLSASDLIIYELAENVKRLAMTWQDRVRSIAKYHKAQTNKAGLIGQGWAQKETGKLLGIEQSDVSRALRIAKELDKDPDGAVAKSDSLVSAIQVLLKRQNEELQKEKVRRMKDSRKGTEKKPRRETSDLVTDLMTGVADGAPLPEITREQLDEVDEVWTEEDIVEMYYHGDAIATLREVAKDIEIHHIVTDPPYGIDMSNLRAANLEKIVHTHQVEPNLALLFEFLQVAYDVIHKKGFLCFWYDLDHHEKLMTHATKVGWKACRWPFVWCKSSTCSNQAAGYNFTKSTEVCMILRRSEESVLVKKQANNFIVWPNNTNKAHPFSKPFEVWERLISAVSLPGQNIVDPFAGHGSCLDASLTLDRVPYGIELDANLIGEGARAIVDSQKMSLLRSELMSSSPL